MRSRDWFHVGDGLPAFKYTLLFRYEIALSHDEVNKDSLPNCGNIVKNREFYFYHALPNIQYFTGINIDESWNNCSVPKRVNNFECFFGGFFFLTYYAQRRTTPWLGWTVWVLWVTACQKCLISFFKKCWRSTNFKTFPSWQFQKVQEENSSEKQHLANPRYELLTRRENDSGYGVERLFSKVTVRPDVSSNKVEI